MVSGGFGRREDRRNASTAVAIGSHRAIIVVLVCHPRGLNLFQDLRSKLARAVLLMDVLPWWGS